MSTHPILKVSHLTKRFLSVVANQNINLEISENEILGIIGENGAGKSTFCKMLTGINQPDDGEIFINGEPVHFDSPKASMQAGINMVYQERNLIGSLTAAQNICLGNEPLKGRMLDEKEMLARANELMKKLGLSVPLNVPVEKLGAGEQQLVEIMRAFYTNPKLLILDEPTASLGEGEIEPFLSFIKGIKKAMKISVIFISHKIEEVFEITDRIAVFTDGMCVMTERTADLTQGKCIAAMLRSDKIKPIVVPEKNYDEMETILSLKHAKYDNRDHSLDIEAKRGEVLGFYGLVGSGRTECAEMMIGMRRSEQSEYTFYGEEIKKRTPLSMIKRGMVMTPEKRADAIFKTFSITDNICNMFLEERLASKRCGFVRFDECKEFAKNVLEKNNVKYNSIFQPILDLSGGNMQKVIIGRSIETEGIKLLILDEPTTGMDVGAKYEIYKKIRALVDENNIGVIFISSELDELIAICDRMYVFSDGDAVCDFKRSHFDKLKILETAIKRARKCVH